MNNTVTFKVAGNDVLTFMDTLRKKADSTTAEMISNAKKQGGVAKDQIKDIEAQIKALEKRNALENAGARNNAVAKRDQTIAAARTEYENKIKEIKSNPALNKYAHGKAMGDAREIMEDKSTHAATDMKDELKSLREAERLQGLQTRLLRDNNDTIKQTSQQQVAQMKRDSTDMVEAVDDEQANDPKWKLANDAAKDEFHKGDKESVGKTLLGGMLNMNNLQGLMGSAGQIGNSQNGFDLIQPAAKGTGNILGSIIGGIIGTLVEPGGGTLIGAGIGGSIGSMLGDTMGQFEQRRLMGQQEFLGGKNRYEATTQQSLTNMPDMTKIGVGVGDYITILREIAINTGNAAMAAENTKDVIEMEKGLGVSKDVSQQMITYFRGTDKNIANLVQGVMSKGKSSMFAGGDYTFLNEFLQKFNALQTELRSSQEKVATGTTFDILDTFNKMGGQFATKDTRSAGLISGVNSALANPASDSLQAMSFLALRKDHPNMSYADLMEEKQKGLASPTYLKSMLKMIDEYGGDRSSKIANSTWLTGGNFAAARRLWDGRGNVHSMSTENIEDNYKGNFTGAAESKTTVIEENMASIKNGLLSTWDDGVDAMVSSFTNAMTTALNGAVINIGKDGNIKMGDMKHNVIPNNVTPSIDGTANGQPRWF